MCFCWALQSDLTTDRLEVPRRSPQLVEEQYAHDMMEFSLMAFILRSDDYSAFIPFTLCPITRNLGILGAARFISVPLAKLEEIASQSQSSARMVHQQQPHAQKTEHSFWGFLGRMWEHFEGKPRSSQAEAAATTEKAKGVVADVAASSVAFRKWAMFLSCVPDNWHGVTLNLVMEGAGRGKGKYEELTRFIATEQLTWEDRCCGAATAIFW
ncbi:hypothetical protein ACFX13_029966 [Malus domestica]